MFNLLLNGCHFSVVSSVNCKLIGGGALSSESLYNNIEKNRLIIDYESTGFNY